MVDVLAVANWVFTVGGILFTLALLPSLIRKETAIPASSSGLTAAVLWTYVGVYALLGITEATLAGAATATVWTLILIFRRPKA